MKLNETLTTLFAGLLFIVTATGAIAQTDSQDHDAHHPENSQAAPAAPTGDTSSTEGMQGGMPGMGMMTPEMMQMMQRMMGPDGMRGMMSGMQGGNGMSGMMSGMQGQGMSKGGMGSGMMACPMTQMMGSRPGKGMPAMMGGDAMLYGMPHGKVEEMTPERVRAFLAQRLEQHGNPRLKLGEIESTTDGNITAEIVTVDGSLVQKLAFNRYPGLFRQITE
jgi:hypothetical protein